MGPRTISVSDDGSTFAAGWALFAGRSNNARIMTIQSQFPYPIGDLDIGSQAIDSSRGADLRADPLFVGRTTTGPVLQVVDSDNLAVMQKFKLAENLAGKSVISSDYATLYSISESGVTVFPIGSMQQAPGRLGVPGRRRVPRQLLRPARVHPADSDHRRERRQYRFHADAVRFRACVCPRRGAPRRRG